MLYILLEFACLCLTKLHLVKSATPSTDYKADKANIFFFIFRKDHVLIWKRLSSLSIHYYKEVNIVSKSDRSVGDTLGHIFLAKSPDSSGRANICMTLALPKHFPNCITYFSSFNPHIRPTAKVLTVYRRKMRYCIQQLRGNLEHVHSTPSPLSFFFFFLRNTNSKLVADLRHAPRQFCHSVYILLVNISIFISCH